MLKELLQDLHCLFSIFLSDCTLVFKLDKMDGYFMSRFLLDLSTCFMVKCDLKFKLWNIISWLHVKKENLLK